MTIAVDFGRKATKQTECLRSLSFDLGEIGLLVVYSSHQNQF